MGKKVLIPTKLNSIAKELLTENGNYDVIQDESSDIADLAAQHPDTYALIVRSNKITPEVIDSFPELKVIVRAGSGVNTIDVKHARIKGIDVMNTPGANSNAVAEEVVALMLADARNVVQADSSTREGKWEKKKFMGREIAGKTIGVVGLGNIGRLVCKRLSGFDVKILGYDPVISEERARDEGIQLVSLPELFEKSDYISLHVPENDETRGMVGSEVLGKIKERATIINCARAGIVDEDALRKAKEEKNIHFLNDVYHKDSEGKKSVADIADIMLPHLGASTFEANYKAARRAAEELMDFDEKGITSFIVNRDIPEGLDEAYCTLANILSKLCRCIVGHNTALKLLETSFYGSLEPFADWLLVPIISGFSEDFDRHMDYRAAKPYLEEVGIEYVNRKVDQNKGYENSITVDMTSTAGSGELRHASVRGTVAEGVLIVSRINEFDKLWFEPHGHTVMFLYDDRPGVLGGIGVSLAEAGINIEDVRNPHDPETNHSLAIMKVNQRVSQDLMKKIENEIDALAAFSIKL